jgi:PIN domain nuclease of toxin-antitoxin system
VILLDTHIWVWWVAQPDRLQAKHRDLLDHGADVTLLHLSPQSSWNPPNCRRLFIAIRADQTAGCDGWVLRCPIMTADSKIKTYPHVSLA